MILSTKRRHPYQEQIDRSFNEAIFQMEACTVRRSFEKNRQEIISLAAERAFEKYALSTELTIEHSNYRPENEVRTENNLEKQLSFHWALLLLKTAAAIASDSGLTKTRISYRTIDGHASIDVFDAGGLPDLQRSFLNTAIAFWCDCTVRNYEERLGKGQKLAMDFCLDCVKFKIYRSHLVYFKEVKSSLLEELNVKFFGQ